MAMLARLLSDGAAPAHHSFSAVARELGRGSGVLLLTCFLLVVRFLSNTSFLLRKEMGSKKKNTRTNFQTHFLTAFELLDCCF